MDKKKRNAGPGVAGASEGVLHGKLNASEVKPTKTEKQVGWREKYKVHPAADVFPMMSDAALADLGRDIKTNGLKHPICFFQTDLDEEAVLIDGRNRLEAMERAGIGGGYIDKHYYSKGDPVSHIIGLNIRRRHLSQQERSDLIVAAVKAGKEPRQRYVGGISGSSMPENKPGQVGPVAEKGGRGKRNPIKEEALAVNAALPKEQQVSERTIKRSLAKAEGKAPAPEPKQYAARPMPKPRSGKPVVGIDAVRQCYLDRCGEPDVDLDAEQEIIIDALREIAGKRAMQAQ
jgi:hypothetical protein